MQTTSQKKVISNNRTITDDRERRLWQSVLLLAVEEALYGVNAYGNKTLNGRKVDICRNRDYLTTPSKDLAFVCANAGFEMDAVIDRMVKLINEAPAPDVLALGKRAELTRRREEKALQKTSQKVISSGSYTYPTQEEMRPQ